MKININKSVVSKLIDKTEMILNVETGTYHELNESGSLVWAMIKNNNFLKEELTQKLELLYKDDLIDINDFLDDLRKSHIIHIRGTTILIRERGGNRPTLVATLSGHC